MQNANKNYNNMVAAKQFTKTYPKDSKVLTLKTYIHKLYLKNLPLQQFKEEEVTEHRPTPTLK